MELKNIGFYTLSNERVKNTSETSQMKRCEMIITEYCNFKCPYCRGLKDEIYGERKIKQPLDMQGVRLEVEVLAVCVLSPYIKNLTDAVLESNIQIKDIVISPLASSNSVLTPQQKELGVVLIDIGAGTTSIAVYNEGDVIYVSVIPVGSSLITEDIAVGFQTEMEIAEKMKQETIETTQAGLLSKNIRTWETVNKVLTIWMKNGGST